jgi:hypothetical protein
VGFLATYFSKNMIVVMLIAMISTNLLIGSKHLRSVKEGMGGNNRKKVVEVDVDVKKGNEEVKESMVKLSPASVNSKKPTLDYAGTVETAYDNLDDLLSSDAIKNMTADTQRLAEKQKQLINNIGKLEPVMKKAGKLLDGIDMGGINSIVSTLSGTLGKLTGDGKQE